MHLDVLLLLLLKARGSWEGATVKGTWFITGAPQGPTFDSHVKEFECRLAFQSLREMTIPWLSE